jgi:rSAM/selenodomain-associated transferase 1
VKPRIAARVGEEAAASLHGRFTDEMVAMALRSRPLLTPVGAVTPDEALAPMRTEVDERLPLWPQGKGDLGERIHRAAHRAFRGGAERVVVIRSDVPDLPMGHLLSAVRRLDRYDLTLGPSVEGGYYLIAMKYPAEELFIGIPWGTPHVLQQTTARARRLGLQTAFLPRWRYVTGWDDLIDLADRLRLRGVTGPLREAVEQAMGAVGDGSTLDEPSPPTHD